jgi:hypothetical protein
MKKTDSKKKLWIKPEIHVLNIKKDTFSGISYGNENMDIKGKVPI